MVTVETLRATRAGAGTILVAVGVALFAASMALPVYDFRGSARGWQCVVALPLLWPHAATLAFLPLAWLRWRRTGDPWWRLVGTASALSALVLFVAVGIVVRNLDGLQFLRIGFYLWSLAPALTTAAFLVAPAPPRTGDA